MMRTYIQNAIDEQYTRHTHVVHASHIPIGIMHYCLRHYARVIGILEWWHYVLLQNLITHQQSILYLKPDSSVSNRILWMHRPPAWTHHLLWNQHA